jgi:predicted HicB family RNase H-like nuclease
MQMYSFEEYRTVIYETDNEYYTDVPEHRFVAYLMEIPEASLRGYGASQEDALSNLREQFAEFVREIDNKKLKFPQPHNKKTDEFSGRTVLRMPSWLHQAISERSEHENCSINTYIVNNLIKSSTIEEMVEKLCARESELIYEVSYRIQTSQGQAKISKARSSPLRLMVNETLTYENKDAA